MMKAIELTPPRGPEVLQLVDLARPVPARGQVLVKVAAAGVNRPDILQRQGAYPPPPGAPLTPGLEIAGVVAGRGAGVDGRPGRGRQIPDELVKHLIAGRDGCKHGDPPIAASAAGSRLRAKCAHRTKLHFIPWNEKPYKFGRVGEI